MKQLIERALRVAKENGATYADVRTVSTIDQQIKVKKGELVGLTDEESKGFGVRVVADGAWGFSSSYQLTADQVERVAKEAVAIAKASAKVAHDPVRLAKIDIHVDDVPSGIADDSRNVPFKKRIAHALEADASMEMQGIVSHSVNFYNRFQEKFFASSEGAFIRQEDVKTGCGMMSFASDGKTYARRSYPAGQFGDYSRDGWSFIERQKLVENGPRTSREALEILKAKPCPKGRKDIIINGSHMALQVHESLGHPVELDRVLGTEAAYAGKSFMTPDL
ncbi:MAG: TldD/PmbA family protein, partial [Caldiserica bacterium]|nr:TldD/PmbA family protein [Caldisericota bacterium]